MKRQRAATRRRRFVLLVVFVIAMAVVGEVMSAPTKGEDAPAVQAAQTKPAQEKHKPKASLAATAGDATGAESWPDWKPTAQLAYCLECMAVCV